jgi:hypothetical protein
VPWITGNSRAKQQPAANPNPLAGRVSGQFRQVLFPFSQQIPPVILLVHGLRLGLPPFPFYGDTSACFFGGGAV